MTPAGLCLPMLAQQALHMNHAATIEPSVSVISETAGAQGDRCTLIASASGTCESGRHALETSATATNALRCMTPQDRC
jgi:hypothetical protein